MQKFDLVSSEPLSAVDPTLSEITGQPKPGINCSLPNLYALPTLISQHVARPTSRRLDEFLRALWAQIHQPKSQHFTHLPRASRDDKKEDTIRHQCYGKGHCHSTGGLLTHDFKLALNNTRETRLSRMNASIH